MPPSNAKWTNPYLLFHLPICLGKKYSQIRLLLVWQGFCFLWHSLSCWYCHALVYIWASSQENWFCCMQTRVQISLCIHTVWSVPVVHSRNYHSYHAIGQISIFQLVSGAEQAGFSFKWLETRKTVFWLAFRPTYQDFSEECVTKNLILLFLNYNICCGNSEEQSRWDGSFEHPKHMLKLMS